MSSAILLWDVKHITTGVFLLPVSDDVLERKTKDSRIWKPWPGQKNI